MAETDIQAPAPDAGQAAPEPAPKGNPWDRIIDTQFDEGGELQIQFADEPEAAEEDSAESGEVAEGDALGEQPPLDKSYEHVRAWATRASQDNAELRKQVAALEQRQLDADAALDADEFVQRVANALPEDPDRLAEVFTDRGKFARVITTTARHIATAQTKALREQISAQQETLAGYGQAFELVAALSPEWTELQPIIANAAQAFSAANGGAKLYDHFTLQDIVTAARAFRDQGRANPQTAAAATTAKGQAQAPPPAATAKREARQPSRAASAAGEQGYAMPDRDIKDLGRERAKGRNAFAKNVDSIIDGVLSNPVDRG